MIYPDKIAWIQVLNDMKIKYNEHMFPRDHFAGEDGKCVKCGVPIDEEECSLYSIRKVLEE